MNELINIKIAMCSQVVCLGCLNAFFLFHFLPLVCGNLRMMNILQKVYFGFILSATLSYKGELMDS